MHNNPHNLLLEANVGESQQAIARMVFGRKTSFPTLYPSDDLSFTGDSAQVVLPGRSFGRRDFFQQTPFNDSQDVLAKQSFRRRDFFQETPPNDSQDVLAKCIFLPHPPGVVSNVIEIFCSFEGTPIAVNAILYIPIAFACTIVAYTITSDVAETVTIKTWKKAAGTAIPTVADIISTSGVSLSAGTVIRSTTLTDFTTKSIQANDILAFVVTAVTAATKITFMLEVKKT